MHTRGFRWLEQTIPAHALVVHSSRSRITGSTESARRGLHQGGVVLEPRHASWFSAPVDTLLRSFQIARVAADPPKGSELAAHSGGWPGLCYWRLHGAPHTYYSQYDNCWLEEFAERLQLADGCSGSKETWVIFDNTVLGPATANAVWLEDALGQERQC